MARCAGAGAVKLQLADDIEAIKCSGRDIPKELEGLQRSFEEKTDWKRRVNALKHLQGLVLGCSSDVLLPLLQRCREALLNQVQDLRSALVREACVTLQLMASTFRADLEFLAVPALPVLLKSTSVTILIIAESCYQCSMAMVRECRTPRVLQVLLDQLRVKGTQRCRAMQLFEVVLQNYSASMLERHAEAIEKALREALEDAQAGVRTAARNCFWAFEGKFQERGQRFLSRLEPQRQRQLRLLATLDKEGKEGNEDSARARPTRVQPESPAPMLLGTITSPANKNVKPKVGVHRLSAWSQELAKPAAELSRGSTNVGVEPETSSATSQLLQEFESSSESPNRSPVETPEVPSDRGSEETWEDSCEELLRGCFKGDEPSAFLERMQQEPHERQRELLRSVASILGEENVDDNDRLQSLKLLQALAQMRLPTLKGALLTDLLQDLLRACGVWPRLRELATGAPLQSTAVERAALRCLRALSSDGTAFRAAAGDLHPLPFKALTALLPELSVTSTEAPTSLKPVSAWANEGQRTLVVVLKGLTASKSQARESSLETLQDLMHHPECCDEFAEVLASKLFQCQRQSSGEQQRKAIRLLERLLAAILPLRAMEILLPLVAETEPNLALVLLPLSLRRLPSRQALDHLVLILPALNMALSCEVAETRKAAILCLVELYLSVGEDAMEVFRKELTPSQLKLVVMYAARQRSPGSSTESPKLSSDNEHLKLD